MRRSKQEGKRNDEMQRVCVRQMMACMMKEAGKEEEFKYEKKNEASAKTRQRAREKRNKHIFHRSCLLSLTASLPSSVRRR
jgi:hypothetical protein